MNKTKILLLFAAAIMIMVFLCGCSDDKQGNEVNNDVIQQSSEHQDNDEKISENNEHDNKYDDEKEYGNSHSTGSFDKEDKPEKDEYISKNIGTLIIDPAYTTADEEWHWPREGDFSSSLSGSTVTMTCDFAGIKELMSETDIEEKEFGAFRLDIYNWDEKRFDYESCLLTIRFNKIELASEEKTFRFDNYEKKYEMELRTDVEEMGRNFAWLDITEIPEIGSLDELAEYKLTVNATVLDYRVKYKNK